jgi:predicted permease
MSEEASAYCYSRAVPWTSTGSPARNVLFAARVAVVIVFAGIATPALDAWHGAIQWAGEAALFGSLFLIGWRLARRQRAAGAA